MGQKSDNTGQIVRSEYVTETCPVHCNDTKRQQPQSSASSTIIISISIIIS